MADWLIVYLHALFGALFIGNMLITFVWKRYADRTGDMRLMRFGADLVIRTDWIFTAPMAGLLVASGLGLAHLKGYPLLETHWLLAALAFVGLSGLVWVFKLVPNQRRQKALLERARTIDMVEADYASLRRQWLFWGVLATVFALLAFLMMFAKSAV